MNNIRKTYENIVKEEIAVSMLTLQQIDLTPKQMGTVVGSLAGNSFVLGYEAAKAELAQAEKALQKDASRLYYGGAYDAASKLSRLNLN